MSKKDITIFTLDAGGTNLIFSAVQNNEILPQKVHLPAPSENLEDFLKKMILGFLQLQQQTGTQADAISFCFPGPADYENGIIGDLENLPFFRGGVPLARMLENEFNIPVFINNDGDLFTLGEAMGGLLSEINSESKKQYNNLLGVTLGTGFGGGIVLHNSLLMGDNSAAAEINRMSRWQNQEQSVEEILSIRGLRYLYAEYAGIPFENTPEPVDILKIGLKQKKGNQPAALQSWGKFGQVLGDALANAVSLTDSCVVIGGGLSGAYSLFLPAAVNQMNSSFQKKDGSQMPRMELTAYNWESREEKREFLKDEIVALPVPFSNETQVYRPQKKVAVGISRLGTSEAVAVGAYAFAVSKLGL
jgi:glucokinase